MTEPQPAASTPMRRWYQRSLLTLAIAVFVEQLLLMCGLNIAEALGIAVGVLAICCLGYVLRDYAKRRWFQFSLRTLLLVMLVVSIGMSWVAVRMDRAKRQREAVDAIRELGGSITYDYEVDQSGKQLSSAKPSEPVWLRNLLGADFFAEVVGVGLWGTKVTDGSLEHLCKRLTKLRALNLNDTLITDSTLEHLKEWRPQLQYLYLDYDQITDLGLEHLRGLTQLRVLGLNGTRITDAGLEHLKGLSQLQELVLWDTGISDAGLRQLRGLNHLRWLVLIGTQVTDAGLEDLKGLAELQSLFLQGTRVTDEGVRKLQQALPNCKIEWTPPTKDERQSGAAPDQPGG